MKESYVSQLKNNLIIKNNPKGINKKKILILYIFVFIYIMTLKFIVYKNPYYFQTRHKLINFKEYKLTFSSKIKASKFFEIMYFSISNINFSFSYKYSIVKLEYSIGIYDEKKKLINPSDISLYLNLNVFCFFEIKNIKVSIYSLPGIDKNSYYKCIEFFKLDEKPTFGIKIVGQNKSKIDFFEIKAFKNKNYIFNDLSLKNDPEFDPNYIKNEYKHLVDKTKNKYYNKALRFKKYYILPPKCNLRRNISKSSVWIFKNIYNHYFCFCIGYNCLNLKIPQKRKYYKYMDIIENNRNLYSKTDYLFVDFIFKDMSSDDAYPIFEEMEKKDYPVHYITENKEIYEKFCKDKEICSKIIKLGKDFYNYANFFEKHLTLVLKLKAVISCKLIDFHLTSFLFFNLEYITYIAVTHGVCYFKEYLFGKKRIYGNMRNNKIVIPPSNLLIEQARKYGWKNEDIIKINLPKWDKYNEKYQLENKDNNKINENSILVMFTWRLSRKAFNANISPFYHENISRILESEALNDALERKNITLYFSFHRYINKKFRKRYQNIIKEKKQIEFIEQKNISHCLAKTQLVVSDFSSIIFDLMYRRKPFILFVPDGNDPKINTIYSNDYIKLIKNMNKKKFKVENLFFSVEKTVNKIISYINNNFTLDEELIKYFKLFGLKEGKNIDAFINYLTNLN